MLKIMKSIINMLAFVAMMSFAQAQSTTGKIGGNTNTTGGLAGEAERGTPGSAGMSGPGGGDTGASSGVKNTTGSLAGEATDRPGRTPPR